jgi:UDP-N-acetyl-2-amino-2-deoxyglucuronate dehydrogenase
MRYGIVGCGVIGPTHAEAVRGLPGVDLVAVCDCLPERAESLASRFGAAAYLDLAHMLDTEHLDVVSICTPSGYHGAHAGAAMQAGAHVVVEKPLEITRPAMDRVLAVRRQTGMKMAVISQHRFDPASVRVHDEVRAGAFGRLVLGNAHVLWWRSQAYYDSGAWRGTWNLDGGGVLMNQAIHAIDLLTWLLGRVTRVQACTDTLVHEMATEDVAVAVLRFASGALGTVAATTGAYPGVTTRVEIFGDQGSAVIEADALGYLHLRRQETEAPGAYGAAPSAAAARPQPGTAAQAAALAVTGHALQIADMLRAVREDSTPLLEGEEARHPVDVILSIYEAARSGREVVLP